MSINYEEGIPFPEDLRPDADFVGAKLEALDRAKIACNTAVALRNMGVDIQPTEEDKENARETFQEVVQEEKPSKRKVTQDTIKTNGSALHLAALLDEYDKEVVQEKAQLRVYVVNKLLEESVSPKDSNRMRALELLGKAAELFTDKSEVTIKHESTEELEKKIQQRLDTILEGEWVNDVEDVEEVKVPDSKDKKLELDEEVKNWNEMQKGLLLSKDIE